MIYKTQNLTPFSGVVRQNLNELMKAKLNAVYGDDLIALLRSLNLLEKIKKGEVKCKFTKEIITLDNLHSIFPEEGTIKVVCDTPEAIKSLSEYINEKNV
jgi:hypothetical protein